MDKFSQSKISALTIDVEDGINISMKDNFGVTMPPTNRVAKNVDIILDICECNNIHATFFILGEIAESFPEIIRKIANKGHEIGIHGYYHDKLYKLKPEEIRQQLKSAKSLMEDLTGNEIWGFRAPAFSINRENSWALRIVAECGFKYDSSIVPAKMGRYGWKDFEKQIVKVKFRDDLELVEVPLPVIKLLGKNIPACGGGYLRYFPFFFTDWAFSTILKRQPVIVYIHPYELDIEKYPEFFIQAIKEMNVIKSLPLHFYRYKKKTVKHKLELLVEKHTFKPLKDIVETFINQNVLKNFELES